MAWLLIFLRGMMMGAADIVPGVSGGTIAFVTGIYDRLIDAISGFAGALISLIRTRDFRRFVVEADLVFLVTLLLGILSSVFLLAALITYAINTHPIEVWSFFCGLILASIILISLKIKSWNVARVFALVSGALFAWLLTESTLFTLDHDLGGAFLSGAIAICAMILPGISGSFLLLLLGTYTYVIGAIKSLDLIVLFVFSLGCLSSLLIVSKFIAHLLKKYHDATLCFLLGLMIGSVNKIWPWKETLSFRENSKGELVPFDQMSVWPHDYEAMTGASPEIAMACIAFLCGILLIVSVSKWITVIERMK